MADTNNSSGNQKSSLSWSQPSVPSNQTDNQKSNVNTSPANTASKTTAAAEATSNAGMYISIFVVGLIIGALIGWGISASHNSGSPSTTASSTNTTAGSSTAATIGTTGATSSIDLSNAAVGSQPSASAADNITVASTQSAGFDVAVQKISVSQPTWLVVYENHNGVPGNAIGAGLFFSGQQSGTIELLRATLPGQKYFVGQSLDDGDKIFSLEKDKPVRDSQGNPLFTQFTAQ